MHWRVVADAHRSIRVKRPKSSQESLESTKEGMLITLAVHALSDEFLVLC